MSQTVTVPGVGDLDFPDGMSQPDMAAAIQRNFPHLSPTGSPAPAPAAAPAPSLSDQISSGIKSAADAVSYVAGSFAGSAVDGVKSAVRGLAPLAQSSDAADGIPVDSMPRAPAPPPPPPADKLTAATPTNPAPLHIPDGQPWIVNDSEKSPARLAREKTAASGPQVRASTSQEVTDSRTEPMGSLASGYWQGMTPLGKAAGTVIEGAGQLAGSEGVARFGAGFRSSAAQHLDQALNGNRDNLSAKMIGDVVGLMPAFAGAPGITALVGSAAANGYGDAIDAGDTPSEAVMRGTAMGLANYIGMRVQLPGITKALSTAIEGAPAGAALEALGHAMTTNVGGMEATSVLSDIYDKIAPGGLRPDMTAADMLHDIGDTAKSAALLSFALPGVPLGAAHLYGTARALVHGSRNIDAAKAIDSANPPSAGTPMMAAENTAAGATAPRPSAFPGLDTLHDSIDEVAQKVGLSPLATAKLRDAAAQRDPQDQAAFVARALHQYDLNGLTTKAGAPGAFRDALAQRVASIQPAEPAKAPAPTAPTAPIAPNRVVPDAASLAEEDYSGLADAPALTPEAIAKAGQIDAAAHQAATSPLNALPEPTDAQKSAGNYPMGHVQLHGMDITIENPQGSVRSGVDPDGKPWANEMAAHYGYLRSTRALDGDHVDTFIGPNPDSQTAYVIDQVDPSTGKFDEPKTILGADSEAQARDLYAKNYADGWNGLGAITPLPMDAFKAWVRDGVKDKPLGDITQWKPAEGSTDERAQPDVASPADVAPGAGDAGGGPVVAGGGDLRPDPAVGAGRDVGGDAAAPAGGARAAGPVGDGGAAGAALTPAGPPPRLLGKPVTDYETPALQKIAGMKTATQRARDVAAAEISRRSVASAPPAPRAEASGAAKHPATVQGSRLLSLVSKNLGGLDPAWLGEFSSKQETKRLGADGRPITQWKNPLIPGVGKLFRRGGTQDLESIAQMLQDHHYLPPGTVERDSHAAGQQAQDIIRAALNRVEAKTMDEQQADDEASRHAEADAHYAALDAASAKEAEAERAAIMAEHEFSHADATALEDDDLDWFTGRSTKEIRDGIAQAADQPGAQGRAGEAGQDAAEGAGALPEAGSSAPQRRAEGADEGLSLTSQTAAGLKAKATREGAARNADAAEQKRLADKATADAQRGDFALTGSDRPADVAAAHGQAPLLSQHTEPFYSHLERSLTSLNMKAGDAGAWRQALKGLQGKGVKAEEIAWSGIDDWLAMQSGKVSKQQVLDYLAGNGVKVTETMLGAGAEPVRGKYVEAMKRQGATADEAETMWKNMLKFAHDDVTHDEDSKDRGFGLVMKDGKLTGNEIHDAVGRGNDPKFEQYTLPGGENYRELLMTLPPKPAAMSARRAELTAMPGSKMTPELRREYETLLREEDGKKPAEFQSGHWDQPNVLAHVRFNDRTDAEGKKVLFIEEVQSDWGQQGKKRGFSDPNKAAELRAQADAILKSRPSTTTEEGRAQIAERMRLQMEADRLDTESAVPAGPFVGKTEAWLSLAIKRMAKYAVDHGYDRVAFTDGEQNASRYDLSKSISRVELHDNQSGGIGRPSMEGPFTRGTVRAYDHNGKRVVDRFLNSPQELEDAIGKETASKLLDRTPVETRAAGLGVRERSLEGLDLKVGGEGMKSFYDKIVPGVAKDVVRKLGGEGLSPVTIELPNPDNANLPRTFDPAAAKIEQRGDYFQVWADGKLQGRGNYDTREQAEAFAKTGGQPLASRQPGFDITDKMRATAADGVPLFKQAAEKPAGAGVDPVALRAEVGRIQAGWKDAPPVHVVDDVNGLPKHIQDSLQSQGAEGNTRGLMMPGKDGAPDQVYLIANRLRDMPTAQFTLFHEVLGHYGIRKVLGTDAVYSAEMYKLRQANPGLAREAEAWLAANSRGAIAARVGRGMSLEEAMKEVRALSTEEALADRAGRGEPIRGMQSLMAKIQQWLRSVGLHGVADRLERMTGAETAALLAHARSAVEGGAPGQMLGRDLAPALSKADSPELPVLSQHTPEEKEALARAGIGPRASFKTKVQAAYGKMIDTIQNRGEIGDALKQGTLDQFHGINRAVRREFGNLPVEADPYITARLANGGTSSVMRALLLHGQARWAENGQHLEKIEDSKGLLDILAPLGDDLNDFFGWMVGNRASRLMSEGRENNFTADQIKALQGLGSTTPEKLQAFKTAAKEYAKFKRSVLDLAQDAGIINGDSRAAWDNADHIPFYRQIDSKATFSATGKKGLAGQSSGVRVLRGGDAALNDPMENLLMNFSRLVDASLKNNALRKTVDTLAGRTSILQPVGYDMKSEVIPAGQVKKMLVDAGVSAQTLGTMPPNVFEGMSKMLAIKPPESPEVVRVMVDGKPTFYQVHDPLLLKALTSFVPFDFPGLGVARAFKRMLTQNVTAAPEFMIRNFMRDAMTSGVISRDGIHLGNSLVGIKKAFKEEGGFEDMLFAGASFQSGNIDAADPKGTAKAMRRALRERGMDATSANHFVSSIVDSPARAWEMYRHMGEAVENANREAVYAAAKKAGRSTAAAAYEAKDLMDFGLRGSSPVYQLAADVLPFFNARVQGLYRLGRSDPKKVARYGALMSSMSVALEMHNSGQQWYEDLPDFDKDQYWHLMMYGRHFRIPKPFELGAIFGTVPERITRRIMGYDTTKKMGSRLLAAVRDQLAFDPVPQIFRPILDVATNTNNFTNAPIEKMADEGKLPTDRYGVRTSETAKVATHAIRPVADSIGLSPERLEYLLNGYLGTSALYGLGLTDWAVRKMERAPAQPAMRLDQYPIVKSFYRQDPAQATVYESDLYQLRQKLDQTYSSVKAREREGDPGEADKLIADNPEMAARDIIDKAAYSHDPDDMTLASLRKMETQVYQDKDATPEEKRAALDQIQTAKNRLVRNVMNKPEIKAIQ